MLPVLLAAEVTDPLAVILGAGGMALSGLLGLVVALVSSRASHLESTVKEQGREIAALSIEKTKLEGRANTAEAEIAALKKASLTRELFEERTNEQDRKLDRLDGKVEKIDRGLVARPTRSEMSMPAVRPPARCSDGPSDSEPPSDPPPMRKKLPSMGRYGGE